MFSRVSASFLKNTMRNYPLSVRAFAWADKRTVEKQAPRNRPAYPGHHQEETITIEQRSPMKDAILYAPKKEMTFNDKQRFLVFDSKSTPIGNIPWEIKETTVKNMLGILAAVYCQHVFNFVYTPIAGAFLVNWVYRVWKFMAHAVVKMELHSNGADVTLTLKTGSTIDLKIIDINKVVEEKTLVETFDDPYLFPIEVVKDGKKTTYYFYGKGQEPIKDGEVFRAIINGRPLKI